VGERRFPQESGRLNADRASSDRGETYLKRVYLRRENKEGQMRKNNWLPYILTLGLLLAAHGPSSMVFAQTAGGPCWTVPDMRVVNGTVVSSNKTLCAPNNRRDCFLVPVIVQGGGSAVAGQRVLCPPRPGCHLVNKVANGTAYWDFQC
jgi:hypothetical protein